MRFSALFEDVFGQTTLSSLPFEKEFYRYLLAGFFNVPLLRVKEKMQETGVTVFRPYPGEDYQTICRCHSQVAAHSPEMFLDWVLFWSRALALDLRRELTRRWYLRGYWYLLMLFTHITDIDTPDTSYIWGQLPATKPHNPLLTKSEKRMLTAYI